MLEVLGKEFHHVFTADNYPQGNITVEMLQQVVNSYNVQFHEAPVFVGHTPFSDTSIGDDEPQALAWIESLLLVGSKLYASFSYVSNSLIWLTEDKRFKYVSAEFVYYDINGKQVPYFYALALTNRQAVHNLEPLEFKYPDQPAEHIFNNKFSGQRLQFTQINNSFNQTNYSMNQFLLDAAKGLGIDVTKFTTESSLSDAIKATFTAQVNKVTELTTKVTDLESKASGASTETPEMKKYNQELSEMRTTLCEALADTALASKKIVPEQKESIVAFAKADFNAAKKYVELLPVNAIFTQSVIKDDASKTTDLVSLDDPKFKSADGKAYTYAEVIKDAALLAKFTDAELHALKAKS